jgi:hypothetical protein
MIMHLAKKEKHISLLTLNLVIYAIKGNEKLRIIIYSQPVFFKVGQSQLQPNHKTQLF